MQELIRIGSRKSKLALVQTEIVKKKIEASFRESGWRSWRCQRKGTSFWTVP